MGIKYANADWAFNSEKFAEDLQQMSGEDCEAACELMGVTMSAMHRWRTGKFDNEFNFPRMSNFIHLCNLLDLDPRDYFTL